MSNQLFDSIRETFFQECGEQLCALETGLVAMERGDCDPETINSVFRAVHTIKGGAAAFDLGELADFAHRFETALDEIRDGTLKRDAATIRVLLHAADHLAKLTEAASGGLKADEAFSRRIILELDQLTAQAATLVTESAEESTPDQDFGVFSDPDSPADAGNQQFTIDFRPFKELYAKANEPALLIRELSRMGALTVTCDTRDLPPFDLLDPEGSYLSWTITLSGDSNERAIQDTFEFVEGDCELAITRECAIKTQPCAAPFNAERSNEQPEQILSVSHPKSEAGAPIAVAQGSIRVDIGRIDRLLDYIGELVIHQSMLFQSVVEAGFNKSSDVMSAVVELEQMTREIQDRAMAIRAQPVKPVFQRMSRIVRETAALTGKLALLETEGDATEVDMTVVERIAEPLTHLIRNAVDHGIETPELRVSKGKAAEGTIRLRRVTNPTGY